MAGKMDDQNRCDLEIDLGQMNPSERHNESWFCCLPCYWLKTNSGFHKMFLSLITLFVTALLVASPVLFLISTIPGEKLKHCKQQGGECTGPGNKVCLTPECSKAGSRISSFISWKANPCQNFYQFACGSWSEKSKMFDIGQEHRLDSFVTFQKHIDQNIQSLLQWAANSDSFRKLGEFYKSCIQVEDKPVSLLPILSTLEELGGYAAPKEDPSEDLTDLVLSLLRLNGALLFDIYLDSGLDNSSELAPFIDFPPGLEFNLGLEHKCHQSRICFRLGNYFSEIFSSGDEAENSDKEYRFLKPSVEERRLLIMQEIMKDFMPHNLSFQLKYNETRNTLNFANIITKLYLIKKEVKNYRRESNGKIAVNELERKFPFIRWQYLLEKFLNVKVLPHDEVFVLVPDYLENLQRTLHRFPFRVIHNGLLVIFATDILYELVNASASPDWTAFCKKMTVNAFGNAVSVLFVKQYAEEYVNELQRRATQIFNTLKTSFEKRIERISWMDKRTRRIVLQKLAALQIQFLSSPYYWNSTYVSSLMADVQVYPEDFFGNVIRRYRQMRNVPEVFRQDRLEGKQCGYPFLVNSFYFFKMNTLIIPLALLTQPYFNEKLPLYISYSTLGLIIAHEILHGFDMKGMSYDSEGNFGIFMSQDSRAKFEARLDCFVKQFSSSLWRKVHFLSPNINIQFDWNMTKSEKMAEISGLQVAYQAWKSVTESNNEDGLPGVNLNSHQLFFLNAAQTYCAMLSPNDYIYILKVDFHTPTSERVNGILMNSPEFGEAYNCSLGSPMNPKKKCSVW